MMVTGLIFGCVGNMQNIDFFTTQPNETHVKFYHGETDFNIDCSDSHYAILTDSQYKDWLKQWTIEAEDGEEFCSFLTTTLRFTLDKDQNFVLVVDSGGEVCTGEFSNYCDDLGIPSQNHVDSPILNDVEVSDWDDEDEIEDKIYTGACDDNIPLIKIYMGYKMNNKEYKAMVDKEGAFLFKVAVFVIVLCLPIVIYTSIMGI